MVGVGVWVMVVIVRVIMIMRRWLPKPPPTAYGGPPSPEGREGAD